MHIRVINVFFLNIYIFFLETIFFYLELDPYANAYLEMP